MQNGKHKEVLYICNFKKIYIYLFGGQTIEEGGREKLVFQRLAHFSNCHNRQLVWPLCKSLELHLGIPGGW